MIHLPKYLFVFDCESVGLHGDTFAAGGVVIDRQSRIEMESFLVACPARFVSGTADSFNWIRDNVPEDVREPTGEHWPACSTAAKMRSDFWQRWEYWHTLGAQMAADVAWPVEARFLADCIADDRRRIATAPYPLLEISTVLQMAGMNPKEVFERRENEQPAHNPVKDARQSARLLMEAIDKFSAKA